jgi:hypothetical protein
LATYRIVCTDQEPYAQPKDRAHIVAVGTGTDPAKATAKYELEQVLAMLDRGDVFYTQGIRTGMQARVVAVYCAVCFRRIIKSTPDATTDNNLDGGIRFCSWTS